MTQMEKLSMLVSHAVTARQALERNQAAALAGTLDGDRLTKAECDLGCPHCIIRCAGIKLLVADIESQIGQLGGLTIDGVSYAFAGRA